jgi:hypothetical protein
MTPGGHAGLSGCRSGCRMRQAHGDRASCWAVAKMALRPCRALLPQNALSQSQWLVVIRPRPCQPLHEAERLGIVAVSNQGWPLVT